MRPIKAVLYALLAIAMSAILGIGIGWAYLSILNMIRPTYLNQQDLIDKKVVPPFFLVVGFSSKTGEVELLRLYEFSEEIRKAAASGLTKSELVRDFGPIVFEEDNGDYSYTLDPTKIDEIETVLDLDTKYPNIDWLNIESTDGQVIALVAEWDYNSYEFTYEVDDGHVTPITYRDIRKGRGRTALAAHVGLVVFLLSIAGFVLWGAWDDVKQKTSALLKKSRTKK